MLSSDINKDMPSACCGDVPRIELPSTYVPKGTDKKTAGLGMEYYESAPPNQELDATRKDLAVIVFYDVVGPGSKQTIQQVDRISAGLGGVKVVSPDFFMAGGGYPGLLGPGHTREGIWEWFNRVAPIEKVEERVDDIISVLKLQGYTRFVHVGFCWGAITGFKFAAKSPPVFLGLGLIHGRAFTADDAPSVKTPLINLPSANEGGPQSEFHDALPEEGNIKALSEFKLFGDVPHGFASGRGDWTDETKRKRAQEVIEDYVAFVEKVAFGAGVSASKL